MKRFFVVLLFVSLLCSCSNLISHKENEIQWEDNLGNSIYFSWDIFGDAAVNYKNADGNVTLLRNYAYSDSHERMNIYISPNSKNVCLLVYETTDKKYKTGSVLNIIQMSEKKDCIEKQNII